MAQIKSVQAVEILDSRGQPTIEVACQLAEGIAASASVPSGASTGLHEALELRDDDQKRYGGRGVLKAMANVNGPINERIHNKDWDQASLDQSLDPNWGANATLGVSMAFARAAALAQKIPLYRYLGALINQTEFKLPQPFFNVINGGRHADSGLELQEFMIAPIGFASLAEKVQVAAEIIAALHKDLKVGGYDVSVGDEGGFAPKLATNEQAFDFITQAITAAGYNFNQVKIGFDAAASSFSGQLKKLTSAELIAWYQELVKKYPIISIEDGLTEDDWAGFADLFTKLGNQLKIIGDDLTVTNVERIKTAAAEKAINTVIIKPNQIGTVTATIAAILETKKQGWAPFASHRSGETTDTFIADLAVGLGCDFIKAGSLARGERVCKYNRLMEIERELKN